MLAQKPPAKNLAFSGKALKIVVLRQLHGLCNNWEHQLVVMYHLQTSRNETLETCKFILHLKTNSAENFNTIIPSLGDH